MVQHSRFGKGVFLAAVGALLAACGGGSGQSSLKMGSDYSYGSIPPPSSATKPGGVLTVAEEPGSKPNWILPITPGAYTSVENTLRFQDLSWRPVYWFPKGSTPTFDYSRSMTSGPPAVSDGGRTYTIKLNGRYSWSTGGGVTARDVLFDYYLEKAAVRENAANFGNYVPGEFPDNVVSAKAVDDRTVAFTFNRSYNQEWILGDELSQLIPLPAAVWSKTSAHGPQVDFTNPANAKGIYDFLVSQSKSLSTYAANPLWQAVDGPYKIKQFNPSTGEAAFAANPAYTGEGRPRISEVRLLSYTSSGAELNDLLSHKLDLGYVMAPQFTQLGRVRDKGFRLYGMPADEFAFMYFNFQDGANGFGNAVRQLYIRQAFAHLEDQSAEIKGAFSGMAAPSYGVVPVAPKSPYAAASTQRNRYPFSIDVARRLLSEHGWKVVPGGVTTCQRPGTAADQCGAGIHRGQSLDFTFVYANQPATLDQMITAFAANLKQIGVTATLKTDSLANIIQKNNNVSSPANRNSWGMADYGVMFNADYPTTGYVFRTGGANNLGGYSDPAADKLMDDSKLSPDHSALAKELDAISIQLPVIFEPVGERIFAWNPKLSGDPEAFAATTQFMLEPEDWYFTG